MSAVPISQLPEISITDPNAYLVIVTSGTTYKITFSALTEQFLSNTVGAGYVPLSTGGTQYTPSSIYQADSGTVVLNGEGYNVDSPEILRLSAQTGSYNIATAFADTDNYAQINIQNVNPGTGSTADFVATADNGTETTFYVDMGINNSNYVNNGNGIGNSNDAYFYSTGENLLIGNATPGKKVVIFNGGLDSDLYAVMYVHEEGSISINTSDLDLGNPAAFRIVNINNSTGSIVCENSVDDFNEINNINILGGVSGENASSDLVTTNDVGHTDSTRGYTNMGINSSSYAPTDNVGGPGDGYIFTTGRHFHIGNANTDGGSNVYIFAGGASANEIVITVTSDKFVGINTLDPQYPMDISGDTRVTGNFRVYDGQVKFDGVIEAQDNADAILSGLTTGDVYRTGDFLKIVH